MLDDDQGCCIGTLLLAIMWLTTFKAGAESFVGYALPETRAAAELADWLARLAPKILG